MICKFSYRKTNFYFCYCFILTMWYVNYYKKGIPGGAPNSFILTMWYVNFISFNASVLY